jgi:6-pyruvoyltetrahydropterin/6-carboxytetrahydropterin synthase
MYAVRVEADFAASHFLSHYQGKCENLHGHNYRVRLWVEGETLNEGGMLADFGLLKRCLRQAIAPLDHHHLNDNPVFEDDPSAERIARDIFEQVRELLPEVSVDPDLLRAVEVYETPLNMARYGGPPRA